VCFIQEVTSPLEEWAQTSSTSLLTQTLPPSTIGYTATTLGASTVEPRG